MLDATFHSAILNSHEEGLRRLLADVVLFSKYVSCSPPRPERALTHSANRDRSRPIAVANHVEWPNDSCSRFGYRQTMGWWTPAGC